MSWHLQRLCGFDLETSGVDVEKDRVVTACIVQCGGGQEAQSATWVSDAGGIEIPAAAAAVHGYDTARVRAEGKPAAEVIEQLVAGLTQVVLAGTPLVIMNAPYDLTLLDREARRYGIKTLTDTVGNDLRVIDPRILDKRVDPYRRGKRTLTDLCRHWQVPLDGAHTADADAIAACRVAWRIASTHGEIGKAFLDELHELQETWAAQQAASFQEYLRQKDPAAVIDGSWPLRPAGGAA